mmetsp:Transcript_21272/g.49524  ORF Transcript_21272/g.49524 Transcript_21272/m.49524 type:complete len:290 (-) Transcript_21272:201-1070(-)
MIQESVVSLLAAPFSAAFSLGGVCSVCVHPFTYLCLSSLHEGRRTVSPILASFLLHRFLGGLCLLTFCLPLTFHLLGNLRLRIFSLPLTFPPLLGGPCLLTFCLPLLALASFRGEQCSSVLLLHQKLLGLLSVCLSLCFPLHRHGLIALACCLLGCTPSQASSLFCLKLGLESLNLCCTNLLFPRLDSLPLHFGPQANILPIPVPTLCLVRSPLFCLSLCLQLLHALCLVCLRPTLFGAFKPLFVLQVSLALEMHFHGRVSQDDHVRAKLAVELASEFRYKLRHLGFVL